MPETSQNGNDQRVTNATIALKLDHMSEQIANVLKKLEDLDFKQREDHDRIIGIDKRSQDNEDEINRLRSKFDVWNMINSGLAVVAGALGIGIKGP